MRVALSKLAVAAALAFAPGSALACTVAGATTDLGSHSSYVAAASARTGSGSAGLSCDVLLAVLSAHYVALRVDASTFQLTGPGGSSIAYQASLTPNGTALAAGNFVNLSSISILSLFAGTNSSVPIYIRTIPTSGLRAGTYKGHIDLRWYYSVCSLGVAVCLAQSSSPGFNRPLIGPIDWGTGTAVRVSIELRIANDCIIQAPDADFGAAPLAGSFNPVTRTIQIRCSAGAAYSVGLDNGSHALGSVRRMQGSGGYLAYEIYKSATSPDRWGKVGAERRASSAADVNAGIYDSATTQSFTYRAAIDPSQPTPPAGTYSDTVILDVEF
ncbi:Spore coat protein U (SCPU) domain-containing protein [Sphingopyxis sp. YR583]|uniref:Csu type fimbrial protein n=1 Tax=Sphingopyxis sp. YR583 TaxID=1881047 RepID=UPI0008A74B09|nr:spore coat U domain-containing protein [Sphingopyxis sp. YR583]SEH12516.1 Spore coat protein U (SCPU) domain-containing protein [Sphingopyxis sp. YR583]